LLRVCATPAKFIELSQLCHAEETRFIDTTLMKTLDKSRQMSAYNANQNASLVQKQTTDTAAKATGLIAVDITASVRQKPRLEARLATTAEMVTAAQRLRADIFSSEYGVTFDGPEGLDIDHYDSFCEHMNVYDIANDCLIATTRLLTAEQARLAGGFYSAQEFDLSALDSLSGRILEIGRTCVHPDYRSGGAITVLWSGVSEYLLREGFTTLIGCASISLADGGTTLASVMPTLREKHFVGNELRVSPSREIILSAVGTGAVSVPPLLKAYLRMGARIGGEACWDPEFNCADVFILMDVQAMAGRYAQRFLKTA
jgi:putative hemolysin